MRHGFTHLGVVVRAGLERVGIHGAVKEKMAGSVWAEVVGEKTAAVTMVENVRDGIVYVTCRDSLWAQELHFLRPVIIQKLNERLGGEVIREIRLSGVGLRKRGRQKEERAGATKEKVPVVLSREESEELERAATRVEDPDLAERVLRGLKASRALRKSHEQTGGDRETPSR